MKRQPHPRMRGPRDQDRANATLRGEITRVLEAESFPEEAYRDSDSLSVLLEAGFDVASLATAFDISERYLYATLDDHDLDAGQPPSTGPARTLWETPLDTVEQQVRTDGGV